MTRLNFVHLGNASALVTAIAWTLCTALVVVAPVPAMWITGHMLHVDPAGMQWSMTSTGFAVGLLSWSALAWIAASSVALLYRRMSRRQAGVAPP